MEICRVEVGKQSSGIINVYGLKKVGQKTFLGWESPKDDYVKITYYIIKVEIIDLFILQGEEQL